MFKIRSVQLLLASMLLSSCADPDFYQKDALVREKYPAGITNLDSVWVVAGRHYDRSSFYRFFWGDHNRDIWTTPVKAKVFNLNQAKGGLTIDNLGGGFQTTSFELEDSAGRKYAFRSLDKDPVHVLYKFWQPTFVTDILRDQTSAANPYGALVVPALAEAAGMYHTNPELYYVPATDKAFGEYAPLVQGKLFLLEEKYKTPDDFTPAFGNIIDFMNSQDALHNRYESNTHQFDQESFARARLLDLVLGDWDRHHGQWNWAVTQLDQETNYKPVPKDRDQVFFKMDDGVIPFIATSRFMARKFQTFKPEITDVKALMLNAAFIDERLLHELTREDFLIIAKQVQMALTDVVIERAVLDLPTAVYKKAGKSIAANLKSRRDQLPEAAKKMYAILAKEVTIAGSDEPETFAVNRLDDERTEVTVTSLPVDDSPSRVLYSRVFYRTETEKITLYGLAADDEFLINGKVKKSIPVNIYGGLGEDKITDLSEVSGWKKYTKVYDTERGNEISLGTEAKDRTTRDVRVHAYDREGN